MTSASSFLYFDDTLIIALSSSTSQLSQVSSRILLQICWCIISGMCNSESARGVSCLSWHVIGRYGLCAPWFAVWEISRKFSFELNELFSFSAWQLGILHSCWMLVVGSLQCSGMSMMWKLPKPGPSQSMKRDPWKGRDFWWASLPTLLRVDMAWATPQQLLQWGYQNCKRGCRLILISKPNLDNTGVCGEN